ncbi:MAG TPA: PEP-CTERM sorting domain-containing protein [Steroidobacteraceae bacterium]|nr:PEP-CTERM sorting domain-containing protein [Steroidobacteraceae bacterium]
MRRVAFALMLGAAVASNAFALPIARYSFQTLNDPDAAPGQTYAYGINDSGQVTGWFIDGSGVQHAFIYSAGTWTTIDGNPLIAGGAWTQGLGINDSGQLVGSLFDGMLLHQAFYNGTSWSLLGEDPSSVNNSTSYFTINNSGSMTGEYEDSSFHQQAFLYDGSTYTDLVNPYVGSTVTVPWGLNNAGDVTGYFDGPLNQFITRHGFIFDGTTFTGFDVPGASFTTGWDINDAGTVVGTYTAVLPPATVLPPAFFLYDGASFFDIDIPYDPNGVFLTGINDSDLIVGRFADAGGVHGFIGTPSSVPEPSTLALLAIGLGLMGWRLRAGPLMRRPKTGEAAGQIR